MEQNAWLAKDAHKARLTMEENKFIFEQAETKLKEVTRSSEMAMARSNNLISIIVGMMLGLIGFAMAQFDKENRLTPFIEMIIVGTIYLFSMLILLSKNISGIDHSTIGTPPKMLMDEGFFASDINDCLRPKMMIWSEIENYQDSISDNTSAANKVWRRYNTVLRMLIATPIVFGLSFFIIRCFAA